MRKPRRFLGIDWAEDRTNWRACSIEASSGLLRGEILQCRDPEKLAVSDYELIAVDCPLGTTVLFEAILKGRIPARLRDFNPKYRRTEQRLSDVLNRFKTVAHWREDHSKSIRTRLGPGAYFNSGSHIKPTAALSMVPEVIRWCQERSLVFEPTTPVGARLTSIRMGTGRIVEAHPRLFLYSLLETLPRRHWRSLALLAQARDYKSSKTATDCERIDNRCLLYAKVQTAIRGLCNVRFEKASRSEELFASGHNFDAWLAALTAWAHTSRLTWAAADLVDSGLEAPEVLAKEGHILILQASLPEAD